MSTKCVCLGGHESRILLYQIVYLTTGFPPPTLLTWLKCTMYTVMGYRLWVRNYVTFCGIPVRLSRRVSFPGFCFGGRVISSFHLHRLHCLIILSSSTPWLCFLPLPKVAHVTFTDDRCTSSFTHFLARDLLVWVEECMALSLLAHAWNVIFPQRE